MSREENADIVARALGQFSPQDRLDMRRARQIKELSQQVENLTRALDEMWVELQRTRREFAALERWVKVNMEEMAATYAERAVKRQLKSNSNPGASPRLYDKYE